MDTETGYYPNKWGLFFQGFGYRHRRYYPNNWGFFHLLKVDRERGRIIQMVIIYSLKFQSLWIEKPGHYPNKCPLFHQCIQVEKKDYMPRFYSP